MYDIWFYYKGNDVIRAKSIEQVVYVTGETEITLTEEGIITNQIPCNCELFLIAEHRSYSISSKGLIAICVKAKQD